MNLTFPQMIVALLLGEPVRRQDWTPDTKHFIKLLELPNSYNRSGIVIEYRNGVTERYKFDSTDIQYDKWKTVP